MTKKLVFTESGIVIDFLHKDYFKMLTKTTQEQRKEKRKPFRDDIKYYLKINKLKQKTVAEAIGLTDQEFHNLLTGYQSSAPGKGIDTFEDFKNLVIKHLNI